MSDWFQTMPIHTKDKKRTQMEEVILVDKNEDLINPDQGWQPDSRLVNPVFFLRNRYKIT